MRQAHVFCFCKSCKAREQVKTQKRGANGRFERKGTPYTWEEFIDQNHASMGIKLYKQIDWDKMQHEIVNNLKKDHCCEVHWSEKIIEIIKKYV